MLPIIKQVKRLSIACILLFLVISVVFCPDLVAQTRFYPSYAQIQDTLEYIQQMHPNLASVKKLGQTTHGHIEIYALEITSGVNRQQDKPVWIFTGQVHGSEQLGVKTVLELARKLAKGYADNPNIFKWVNAYDIWLIPSVNPWGYEHIERKNGRSTDDRSTSGVDLNRNFGFRWKHGGEVKSGSGNYRGTQPFSEEETQIIRDLYLRLQPVFGVTFHQGNNPDGGEIMVPWGDGDGLPAPPDATVLSLYANLYADWVFDSRRAGSLCQTGQDGNYILVDPAGMPTGQVDSVQYSRGLCWKPKIVELAAYGQSSNYYYAATRAIDFTIEMSDREFNEAFMHKVEYPKSKKGTAYLRISKEFVRNHVDAIKSWFDYFLYSSDHGYYKFKGPGMTGHVVDAATGKPLKASIRVRGFQSFLTDPGRSNESFGRFWRLLPEPGMYKVTVDAPGYQEQTKLVNVTGGALTDMTIRLRQVSN